VGTTERCEVVCAVNAGCPTGKTCSGSAKESTSGVPGAAVKFCTSRAAAAPPPPVQTGPIRRPRTPSESEEGKKKKRKGKKKAD
jgi:hypothetical protein